MQSEIGASSPWGKIGHATIESWLNILARRLRTGDEHATLNRLFVSRHVKDLQLIVAVSIFAVVVAAGFDILLSLVNLLEQKLPQFKPSGSEGVVFFLYLMKYGIRVTLSFLGELITMTPIVMAPVLSVVGAILAWAYLAGSARLGVVDLFACEISTICKVVTVIDAIQRHVGRFRQGPPSDPGHDGGTLVPVYQFTSQESYFPVFEGGTQDLQTLEANVVIHITEFYTFMKAARDSIRTLADTKPQPLELALPTNKTFGDWHEAARNVIYMLFLSLESARLAIDDLVEFNPERTERKIVILISELSAYGFLCSCYTDEHGKFNENNMYYERLHLRRSKYQPMYEQIAAAVRTGKVTDEWLKWEPAEKLLPELKKRFDAAIFPKVS